jgi:hypothetical protein
MIAIGHSFVVTTEPEWLNLPWPSNLSKRLGARQLVQQEIGPTLRLGVQRIELQVVFAESRAAESCQPTVTKRERVERRSNGSGLLDAEEALDVGQHGAICTAAAKTKIPQAAHVVSSAKKSAHYQRMSLLLSLAILDHFRSHAGPIENVPGPLP